MAAAAAAPVIGGIYDNTMDEHYMSLLLDDPESTAEMYFTSDQVYLDYCSEMNAWVSPLATREEYLNAKRGLESLTADLPDISKAVQFLVTTYRGRIDDLLVNYECILNDTKSAKYDFAFYYMIDSFLEIVEKEAEAALAVALAAGSRTPQNQIRGGVGGSGGGDALQIPNTLAQQSAALIASPGSESSAELSQVGSPDAAAAALAARAAAARGNGAGGAGAFPALVPLPPRPAQIQNLQIYLNNLYQGPHDLIFNEEITQFHIALLIKYMH